MKRPLVPALVFLAALATSAGCSSRVGPGAEPDGSTGEGADSGVNLPDGADTGVDIPYFDTNVYDVFHGNPCPGPPPAPMRAYTCDAFAGTGCPAGQSCYPSIDYPSVQCGAETYRTTCEPSGTASEGDFCQTGTQCRAGFSCFVTGAMNRCLRLCRLDGTAPQCDRGAVCEPTDLPDFGACQ